MADTKLQVTITGKDEASRVLQGINSKIQGMAPQLRMVGVGAAAMGTAIVGAATLSIKKFAEMGDEIAIPLFAPTQSGCGNFPLNGKRHLIGYRIENFQVILIELVRVRITLGGHGPDDPVLDPQRHPEPYFRQHPKRLLIPAPGHFLDVVACQQQRLSSRYHFHCQREGSLLIKFQ